MVRRGGGGPPNPGGWQTPPGMVWASHLSDYFYQSFQNPEFGGGRPQAQSKGLLGGIVGSAILPLYLVIVFAYALYVFFRGMNFHIFQKKMPSLARNKDEEGSSKTSDRKKEIDDLRARLDRTEKALNKLVQATETLQKAIPEEEMKKIFEDFCLDNKQAVEDISAQSESTQETSEEISSSANDDATASDELSESLDAEESQSLSASNSAPTDSEIKHELLSEETFDDDSEEVSEPEKISDEIEELSEEKLSEDEVQVINIDDKNEENDEMSENPNLRQRIVKSTESSNE